MTRLLLVLLWLVLAVQLPAQAQDPAQAHRHAKVTTNDGKVVVGVVLAMDLASLELQVGDDVVRIAASDIRTCHFDGAGDAAPAAPVVAAKAGSTAKPVAKVAEPVRVRTPPPAPEVDGQEESPLPHDLRKSRLRTRLDLLDEAYPWLVPAAPVQWFSIGLLLFACWSLVVHLSTSVVGDESVAAGRCMALAAWYLLTTFLQVAMVPAAQLSTFIMLIANPALALFWLRNLFDLTRGAAMIAFAVQLGFVLLGYGVLELVTALLGSIGASQ